MADEAASFGSRLAAARDRAGLTQRALAESLDVGSGAVSAWEVGRTQPSAAQIKLISDLLAVSADYLLGTKAQA